jgi:Peptidase A4 family
MAVARWRRVGPLFGVVVGVAFCYATIVSTGARGAPAPRVEHAKTVVTPNWSGYVAAAPGTTAGTRYFSSVTGTWTVPPAHCRGVKGASSSTVWVGLGGYRTHNQEEVGTDSNCDASGRPFYYAWFEVVPYLSYQAFPQITDKVAAGDTMTGLVRVISRTEIELRLRDRTRGWTFMRRIAYSSQDTSTAEWVVEAPAECVGNYCHEANLTNFGKVKMTAISAKAHGSPGTLADPRWKLIPIRLIPSKLVVPTLLPGPNAAKSTTPIRKGRARSPAGATPGPPSRDGRSFSLKWIAVANRGL